MTRKENYQGKKGNDNMSSIVKSQIKKAKEFQGVTGSGADNPKDQYSPLKDRKEAMRRTMSDRNSDFDAADAAAKKSLSGKGIRDTGEQNRRMSDVYSGKADASGDALHAKQKYDRMTNAQNAYAETKKKPDNRFMSWR